MFFRVFPDNVKCTSKFEIRRLINYSEDEIQGETKNTIIYLAETQHRFS